MVGMGNVKNNASSRSVEQQVDATQARRGGDIEGIDLMNVAALQNGVGLGVDSLTKPRRGGQALAPRQQGPRAGVSSAMGAVPGWAVVARGNDFPVLIDQDATYSLA